MKRKLLVLVLMLLCGFCLMAKADVTLAIIAPKAGEYVKSGNELFEGARLAVQEFNDNGGINGEKLDLLTIDDRCDDRLALSTAQMLTLLKSKKIVLVVGPYCANRFNDIAAIYEQARIFQIVPTTEVYHSRNADKKGQIMLLGSKAQMSQDFFKFYNQNYAGLKVGFVYDGQAATGYTDVAKSLYDEFRRFGKAERLKFYPLNEEIAEIDDVVEQVVADDVHIVFVLGKTADLPPFVRSIKKKNKDIILFTSKKMLPVKKLKELGAVAHGIYLLDLPGLKDSLMFTESLVNLRLLGIEPEGLETYSYVAVKLWGELARMAKSFDYAKLAKMASSPALKEKWGDFLMHSGRHDSAKYIIEEWHSNGEGGALKQVY